MKDLKFIKVRTSVCEYLIECSSIISIEKVNDKITINTMAKVIENVINSFDDIEKQLQDKNITIPQTCNSKKELRDKQLIWAWDNSDKCYRMLCFYDAKNDCIFDYDGTRGLISYDNYLPYKGKYPQWAKDAILKLDD